MVDIVLKDILKVYNVVDVFFMKGDGVNCILIFKLVGINDSDFRV